MKAMSFELDDDEYPIAIIGRTGLFIDKFGFRTTKGKEKYNNRHKLFHYFLLDTFVLK